MNNSHQPYAIGLLYNHNQYFSFVDTNPETNQSIIVQKFIKQIIIPFKKTDGDLYKTRKYIKVYFHNLNFDGIFILHELLNNDDIQNWFQNHFKRPYNLDINIKRRQTNLISISLNVKYMDDKKNNPKRDK